MRSKFHMGKAAEYRAMSELLMRGIEPMATIIDRGVDLMLVTGAKLQVKAAQLSPQGQYTWKLVQYRYQREVPIAVVRSPDSPDFYLLWAVDSDRWFVVPANKVVGCTALVLNKHKPTVVNEYEGTWHLLDEE